MEYYTGADFLKKISRKPELVQAFFPNVLESRMKLTSKRYLQNLEDDCLQRYCQSIIIIPFCYFQSMLCFVQLH